MNILAILFLLFTLLWAWRKDKCLINPIVVTSSVWLLLLVGYEVIDHGLYPLSDKFYAVFLTWMMPFQIACHTTTALVNNSRHLSHPATPLITNKGIIAFVAGCMFLALLVNYQRAIAYDPTSNVISAMKTLSVAIEREEEAPQSALSLNFNWLAQAGFVMCLMFSIRKVQFKYKYLFVLLSWAWIILTGGNKGAILRFMIGYIGVFVFTKRFNLRILLGIVFSACVMIYIVQLFRDNTEEMDVFKMLYIYIFSSLPAFDHYILHSHTDFITYFDGEFVFKRVPLVGNLICDGYKPANVNIYNYEMVEVPLPTNVYTMLSGYWIGWKWMGVIVGGLFHGCFWGYVYKRAKSSEAYKLFYVSILHALVFYFFHDFLMGHITFNVFVFVFIFFLFYNPIFNRH